MTAPTTPARAGQARVSDEELAAFCQRKTTVVDEHAAFETKLAWELRDARADLADANARIAELEKAGTRELGLREAAEIAKLNGSIGWSNEVVVRAILAALDTPTEGGEG